MSEDAVPYDDRPEQIAARAHAHIDHVAAEHPVDLTELTRFVDLLGRLATAGVALEEPWRILMQRLEHARRVEHGEKIPWEELTAVPLHLGMIVEAHGERWAVQGFERTIRQKEFDRLAIDCIRPSYEGVDVVERAAARKRARAEEDARGRTAAQERLANLHREPE